VDFLEWGQLRELEMWANKALLLKRGDSGGKLKIKRIWLKE